MAGHTRIHWASVLTGALFCLIAGFGGLSCQAEDHQTPEWGADESSAATSEVVSLPRAAEVPKATQVSVRGGNPGDLRFMTYNVENWLTMERRVDDQTVRAAKPEKEKQAVIAMIVKHRPDVLGVVEIGEAVDVADLQKRLAAAGWEMPFKSHRDLRSSPRNVLLLSKYPIVCEDKPEQEEYRIDAGYRRMQRLIVDATVDRGGDRFRFIGVHLKSKREVQDGDQEQMRQQEARLLRRHVSAILKEDAAAPLVVFGDFNDTRNSTAMKQVVGAYRSPEYLWLVPARDSRGHSWTHYWDYQDVYSRFDYVGVSAGLKSRTDFKGSYIVDDDGWNAASDHRPVVVLFRSR